MRATVVFWLAAGTPLEVSAIGNVFTRRIALALSRTWPGFVDTHFFLPVGGKRAVFDGFRCLTQNQCFFLSQTCQKSFADRRSGIVSETPQHQLKQYREQVLAFGREAVNILCFWFVALLFCDKPLRFRSFQSVTQDIGGYVLPGSKVFKIDAVVKKYVADDKKRPLVSEYIESKADRTFRTLPADFLNRPPTAAKFADL